MKAIDLGSRYDVVQLLQTDGLGNLYQAHDRVLKRFVAITVVGDDAAGDGANLSWREQFAREIRIIAGIEHPNVVKIREIIEGPSGLSAVVTDYMAGESLRERMKRGPLSVAGGLAFASQIAAGVAAVHDAGLLMPTLNPVRIHIADDDLVVLFYLDVTSRIPTRLLGTLVYTSPEQITGRGADCRTDVWTLGMVLYEMLAGRCAFGGDFERRVMSILRDAVMPPGQVRANVPSAIDAIVNRALAKNPDERYQSAGAFLEDVQSVAATL